jgi:hypothetical protein
LKTEQVSAMKHSNRMTGTDAAVISINASYRDEISAQELVAIFRRKASLRQWQSHVGVFFSEVPDGVVHDFMKENGISWDMMRRIHSELPPVLQTKKFKGV